MRSILSASFFVLMSCAATAAEKRCNANADTALYADAELSEEIRPIFQFDGAQFIPSSYDATAMYGMAYDVLMQPLLEEKSYTRTRDWICEVLAGSVSDSSALVKNDGLYDVSTDLCQQEISDTRITLSDESIGFYESACDIVGEEAGENDARILSLQCYGEGEEWLVEAIITPQKTGGIEIAREGYTQIYVPCN